MESSVWMTVLIASIVYWGAFLVVMVVALLSSLKNKREKTNQIAVIIIKQDMKEYVGLYALLWITLVDISYFSHVGY